MSVGFVLVALSSLKFLAAWWLAGGRLDGAVLQLALLGARVGEKGIEPRLA